MNILSQITKKASELYRKSTSKGRVFWHDAMRQAAKLVKGIKEGVVTFWELKPDENGDCPVTTRRVATLESIGYQSKTSSKPKGLIKLVDLDKFDAGLPNYIISFYPFQLM